MQVIFGNSLKISGVCSILYHEDKGVPTQFSSLKESIHILGCKGKIGESCSIAEASGFDLIVVAGAGQDKTTHDLREIGANLFHSLKTIEATAQVYVENLTKQEISQIAYGAFLASYTFDKYKTVEKSKVVLDTLTFVGKHAKDSKACFENLQKIAEGVNLARDLVSEPANVLTPEEFSNIAKTLKEDGVKVKVLEQKDLEKLEMGALLGVAQGSVNAPYVAVMEYIGATKEDLPYVFVGKGVTFDSGGISIKPSAGMEDMKFDMGGAAAVIGAVKAIAGRQAKANVVGIIGLVENMPDGNAQRPGDVVTSMDGQTIEVINTDAEGRLVLADCLTYAQQNYSPRCIIDLATLTGAIMVALGEQYAGVFSTDDGLSTSLVNAGFAENELVWPMPLNKEYDAMINSNIADIKNTGEGRLAGSCTAAHFLKRFVKQDVPWAHIDIAGMAWERKGKPLCPKGATGFGVKLLDRLVFEDENV